MPQEDSPAPKGTPGSAASIALPSDQQIESMPRPVLKSLLLDLKAEQDGAGSPRDSFFNHTSFGNHSSSSA